jgi:hypothetical protein
MPTYRLGGIKNKKADEQEVVPTGRMSRSSSLPAEK